jgi:hypothetical protein
VNCWVPRNAVDRFLRWALPSDREQDADDEPNDVDDQD